MRTSWEALHASLVRSIRTLDADLAFTELKTHHSAIGEFTDPGALVAFLRAGGGDLDRKDLVLAALVLLAQEARQRRLANTLLWLGLWPGLDAAYRRRLAHFPEPQELVSELGHAFTSLVDRLDLGGVARVAATLVRNTERLVMATKRREWAEAADRRFEPLSTIDEEEETAPVEIRGPSTIGLRTGSSLDEDLAALRAWLEPVVGDDADLLIGVLVLDESAREAGLRLGVSHVAAQKRLQRALRRVRRHLGARVSQSAIGERV